jgi:hypothetical protein
VSDPRRSIERQALHGIRLLIRPGPGPIQPRSAPMRMT